MAAGAGPRPSEAAAPSATSGVCLSVRLDALFSRPVCLHSLSEHLACTRQHWPECWPPGARRRVCLGQAAVWGVCVSSSQWVLWWKTGPCPAHAEACPLPGDSEMGREAPVAVRGRRAAGERLCGSLAPGSRGDLEWGGWCRGHQAEGPAGKAGTGISSSLSEHWPWAAVGVEGGALLGPVQDTSPPRAASLGLGVLPGCGFLRGRGGALPGGPAQGAGSSLHLSLSRGADSHAARCWFSVCVPQESSAVTK